MSPSHVKIGFLALCLALVVGLPVWWLTRTTTLLPRDADIALLHDQPATLSITRLSATGGSIIDVSYIGPERVALIVPTTWHRQEVRGADLSSVPSDPVDAHTVRWTLPPDVSIRFTAERVGRITFHNPSAIPVTVKTVIVRSGSSDPEHDAVIVTSEPYTLP